MIFSLDDDIPTTFAANEIRTYIVSDQTHINPEYNKPNFFQGVMAFFLDAAYAADVYPH